LVTGVALELSECLAALHRIAVWPPELPARRIAVMAARLASLSAPGRLAGLLSHARQGARQKACEERENNALAPDRHRSTTILICSATSRFPSCLVVALTIQPTFTALSGTSCSMKPALPGSVERANRTTLAHGFMWTTTSRVFPLLATSSARVCAAEPPTSPLPTSGSRRPPRPPGTWRLVPLPPAP